MARSRSDSRPSASALPVRSSEQLKVPFRSSEQAGPDVLAAELFDQACRAAGLENKDVAHLCGVSVSLVEKWRQKDTRGCPSFLQMLLLPPGFHVALHRAMNAQFGFGRAALLDLLDAVGRLAVNL